MCLFVDDVLKIRDVEEEHAYVALNICDEEEAHVDDILKNWDGEEYIINMYLFVIPIF
jgi:hypothetical protein